ncbi:uncharacterized protein [Chelonus insularis]|uniref:uncharacterized protein n=1 Tax=Chelonus insularis TaxID=460826 RepID=UPI001588859A|nr:uncharacterized protein LOC118066716 [Chelonus insularis]
MASGFPSRHQKKLGPAPIASFEDLSDEVENGEPTVRMPGIVEVTSPVTPGSSLKTPSTPRIDISRASSSSHHEDSNNSRESSPEIELLAGAEQPPGPKLSLGYKEDVQDLRSSTEELDLQDPIHAQDLKRASKKARKKKEDGTQSECGASLRERERKDSNCSEIILLNISGRTSRLSSVGSQGSGVSGRLSVVSATSSRSPSPHKCQLETSFCGSKITLAETPIETSKPETDDLEKILLKREADTTKALIPESIKVPIVDGNLKPDPLDKPRRRGREERKEIFKREVEITKKVLEKINIEMLFKHLHLLQVSQVVRSCPGIKKFVNWKVRGHQVLLQFRGKVVLLLFSRTYLQARADGSSASPESSGSTSKPRRSLTSKIKDTTESLRSRSKSRERVSVDKGSTKNKNVFTSTLSLFKKRERKKSTDDMVSTPEHEIMFADGHPSLESIGNVEFRFDAGRPSRNEDSIFISLHADSRNYEEALPSESVSIPLETPTKLLDEYDSEPRTGNIVTEASIEHRASVTRIKTEAKIESTSRDEAQSPLRQSASKESQISKTSSADSRISVQTAKHIDLSTRPTSREFGKVEDKLSASSSRDSVESKKQSDAMVKPKRKSKENLSPKVQENVKDTGEIKKKSVTDEREVSSSRVEKEPEKFEEPLRISENLSIKAQDGLIKTPSVVSDLDHNSSESERDSEIDFVRNKVIKVTDELSDERKGLFNEESFEEDFPYVPTTLPMEKSVAVPIRSLKQRLEEVRTIPIERPRSTTPINPTLLDEFVMQTTHEEKPTDKMKISLPREDSFKMKSPRKHSTNTFTEFAERVVPDAIKKTVAKSPSPPPPLPPRAPARPTNWINFEEIPERRKAPKRIQTIPRAEDEVKGGFTYVQPEDCRCECHEESRRATNRESSTGSSSNASANVSSSTPTTSSVTRASSTCSSSNGERACNGDNCTAPTSSGDRASIVSDSSLECSLSIEDQGATQALLGPMKPFSMDLDVGSNRSSIISQDENDDIHAP